MGKTAVHRLKICRPEDSYLRAADNYLIEISALGLSLIHHQSVTISFLPQIKTYQLLIREAVLQVALSCLNHHLSSQLSCKWLLVCIVSYQASHSIDDTCYWQSIYTAVSHLQVFYFMGMPTLSRFGSSFLSSSLTRRHTPEILPSLNEPLIPAAEDEKMPQQRCSSRSLLPPTSLRKPTGIKKVTPDEKASKVSRELPISRQSSYG
ncbi:unnamed protein product [Fraxinus pennsylvanica]|uniref:Uncharacterized protein n=1 Tax=Fraxinus pennsylvanica TaxID=56036 RepID=A0AAD2DSG9_9LAMI|nr:unnamed protein product [Fraxinus pennsylvanica]